MFTRRAPLKSSDLVTGVSGFIIFQGTVCMDVRTYVCMYVCIARCPSGFSHGLWRYMREVQIWFKSHGVLGQDTSGGGRGWVGGDGWVGMGGRGWVGGDG